MTNEEKILAELENIKAELATLKRSIDDIEMKILFSEPEPEPTSEQQRAAIIGLSQLLTDEEKESFGKYMDEIERRKGIIE